MTNRPKGQHTTPRFYLDQFTDAVGRVWSYDKTNGRVGDAIPDETCKQTNFYSVQKPDGTYDDSIELWLRDIETKAAPIFAGMIEGKIPTGEDRSIMSMFLSTLYIRTPAMLDLMGKLMGYSMQPIQRAAMKPAKFDAYLADYEKKFGPVEAGVRERMQEIASDPANIVIEVSREATLRALASCDSIAPVFEKMGWAVLDAHEGFFLTSDNPVSRAIPASEVHPIYGDGGLANDKVQVTLPLSPKRCLLLRWGRDVPFLIPLNRAGVDMANGARANIAQRYLYADRRDDSIKMLAEKHKNGGLRMRVDAGTKFSEVVIKRKVKREDA